MGAAVSGNHCNASIPTGGPRAIGHRVERAADHNPGHHHTASPGRAKTIIDVPLERPRHVLELRHDPRYGEIVYSIWGHLKDEVERARA